MVRRSSVVVHNFKHEYLCNQWADQNEIVSEASLGWGKGCIRFWDRLDHRVIMEKMVLSLFLSCFHPIFFILAGNDDMQGSSEVFEIQPDPTSDCGVSCP